MTVKELIKELKRFDQDLEVIMFCHDQEPWIDEGENSPRLIELIERDDRPPFVSLHN